jgi:hypothetical protein
VVGTQRRKFGFGAEADVEVGPLEAAVNARASREQGAEFGGGEDFEKCEARGGEKKAAEEILEAVELIVTRRLRVDEVGGAQQLRPEANRGGSLWGGWRDGPRGGSGLH